MDDDPLDENGLIRIMEDMIAAKGKVLEPFRTEYMELRKQSDNMTVTVVKRDREVESLNSELNAVRDQINFTRRNIEELVSTQETMKATVDHIKQMKNSFSDSEKLNRDRISIFTSSFEELKEALAVGADWTPDQLEARGVLEKERDFLQGKLDSRSNQVGGLRGDVDRIYIRIQDLEAEIASYDEKINKAESEIKAYEKESTKCGRKKEDSERKLFELRAEIIALENVLAQKKATHKADDKQLEDLDKALKESQDMMDKYISEYDNLVRALQETSLQLEREKVTTRKIQDEIEKTNELILEKEHDANLYQKEIKKIAQLHAVCQEKCIEVDKEKAATEIKCEEFTQKTNQLRDHDSVHVKKEIEALEKNLATLRAEAEILRKKQTGSEQATRQMADLIQVNINGKRNLGGEKKLIEEDIKHKKEAIKLLLAEKEKYEYDAEVSNQQFYTALEELKLQEMQIKELQKKIMEDQAKLKHKQNLYEAVRSDRNLYSKQLIDCQDEIGTLKRKFRGMNHKIDQLKDEISVKDHAIVKEHFMHHSVDKEKEMLKNELSKIRKQVIASEGIIENQRVEVLKLTRIIEEADLESHRQKNEWAAVVSERNLLTGQVVKRNFELTVMYNKIKLQRSNMRIGERSYAKLIESMAMWQKQLLKIVQEHNSLINSLGGFEDLRFRVIQLEKELLTEQTKARALYDELEQPMNVHRWRVLESADPKRYETILQIQALQKQLISKSDDVIRYDLLIQEKEKVYIELKNIIARQPGPEVEEQVLVYQQTLKDKFKQLASMNEELSMYRQQVSSFKDQLAVIDEEMNKTKKRWFKMKKKQEATMQ